MQSNGAQVDTRPQQNRNVPTQYQAINVDNIKSLIKEICPNEDMDPPVIELLCYIMNLFVEGVTEEAAKLAVHQSSSNEGSVCELRVEHLRMVLARDWGFSIPDIPDIPHNDNQQSNM
eukprot:GHVR01116197.1.p1 GENE.GHVR01116197.1~~GHVR01116197.1.p1  ORF type:complete len:118 (+),score=18.19 GHVR01116197.1:35-388(+)